MKINSETIWAVLLIGTAILSFYLGSRTGRLGTEETLSTKIREQGSTIKVLENKIEQLSDELTSRGIFSYPQANIVSEDGGSSPAVLITLNGREAIHNLEIVKELIRSNSNLPSKTRVNIGTLTAHNPVAFEIGGFKKNIGFNLTFQAGKDRWHQFIRATKTAEGEIKSFWVITNEEREVIDKHVDPGFPVDSEGHLVIGEKEKVKFSDIKMNSVFKP